MSKEHFDAVIIGSGFGGSVMSYRLAEAGFSVSVLERGKAYPPDSFPRSPYELKHSFWDPSKGLYGRARPTCHLYGERVLIVFGRKKGYLSGKEDVCQDLCFAKR